MVRKHFLLSIKLSLVVFLLSMGGQAYAQSAYPSPAGEELINDEAFQVTFLLYSGRENPTMVVRDRAKVKKISQLYADSFAKPGSTDRIKADSHPVLGYNGVLIEPITRGKSQAARADNSEFHVNRGVIRATAPAAPQTVDAGAREMDAMAEPEEALDIVSYDPDHSLENFLLKLAKEQGLLEASAVAEIESSLLR